MAGEQLRVTWGREHFQPIQYHGMDVGPFELTVTLGDDESVLEAYRRARAQLQEIARLEHETKLAEFLGRIETTAQTMRAR